MGNLEPSHDAQVRKSSQYARPSPKEQRDTDWCPSVLLAEGVVRKLNSASPALIELKLGEFNPPEIKPLDKLEFVNQ